MPDRPLSDRDPYVLRQGRYIVLDGDTVQELTDGIDGAGKPEKGERIRFRSIAAPEKTKFDRATRSLQRAGVDVTGACPGHRATRQLRRFTKGRDLLVMPTGSRDPYGRILADIAVFPEPGRHHDFSEAVSLERVMMARGMVKPFSNEDLPRLRPMSPPDGTDPAFT